MAELTGIRIEEGVAWIAIDDGKVNAMFAYATTKARVNADVLKAFASMSRERDEIVGPN